MARLVKVWVMVLWGCLIIVPPVEGQTLLEKMAKKAKEKTEKKLDEKADKEMDKQLDKVFDEKEEKEEKKEDRKGSWVEQMAKMGYSSEPVTIEKQYVFTGSITMGFKTIKSNGKVSSDGSIKLYAGGPSENFAYEFITGEPEDNELMQKGIMIMDMKNKASIILNNEDGKKTGVAFGSKENWFKDDENEEQQESGSQSDEDVDWDDIVVKKTGKTKTILGYKCDEYAYSNDTHEGLAWITREMDWDSKDFMTGIFKSSMYAHGIYDGFLMASEGINKESGEKTTFEVTEINKSDKSTFEMGDYEITNFGSFSPPDKEP